MILEHCELSEEEIYGEEDWCASERRSIDNDIEEIEFSIENLQIDLKNETDEDKKYEIECDIEDLQLKIKWLKEKRKEYE